MGGGGNASTLLFMQPEFDERSLTIGLVLVVVAVVLVRIGMFVAQVYPYVNSR
jgi:hypothetical protein